MLRDLIVLPLIHENLSKHLLGIWFQFVTGRLEPSGFDPPNTDRIMLELNYP